MGASSSWQRESLTFTVPTNAGSSVNVQLKLPGDVSGSVYADCVMLEQADAMNRYNLLENSDFNSNTIWSRGSGLDSNDAIVSVSGSLHPDSLSSAVYKITGSTTADKVVSQTLPISGSTGDCYTFGGWAQMNTVPAFTKNAGTSSEVNYGQRKLRLGFVGASETKYYEASFNPDNSEWQYICGAAVAPGKSLLFSYDANGQAVSVNYNGTEYYYLRNGQNDIVGLMDESGVRVVEYIYDAWGKLISTTGTLATTLGADNPFRYRGYYYDTETGLYYLTTRYYDPEVCRFISADVYMSTGQGVLGGNMWAYCGNNPVCRYDTSGRLWKEILDLVGSIIGFGGETSYDSSVTLTSPSKLSIFYVETSITDSYVEPYGNTDSIVAISANTSVNERESSSRADICVGINIGSLSVTANIFTTNDFSAGIGASLGYKSISYSLEGDISLKTMSIGVTGSRSRTSKKNKKLRNTKSGSFRVNLLMATATIAALAHGVNTPYSSWEHALK